MSDVYPTNPSIGETVNGRIWDGARWNCPALLIDAPADGNLYGRMNNTWQRALPFNGGELLNLLIDYDLSVLGNASVQGGLNVGGSTAIGSSLAVAGNTNIGGTIDVQSGGTFGVFVLSKFAVMALGTDPTGISYGFWQDSLMMNFGDGDSSGNPNNGTMQLDQHGNLFLEGTLTQGCDARLKQAVEDYIGGLDLIRRLKPRSYARKATPTISEIGLVAQDVVDVIPQAVHETKRFLGVEPMALIAVLINGIKELEARLEALDGRISQINRESHHGHSGHR